jgi:hypothetical protein
MTNHNDDLLNRLGIPWNIDDCAWQVRSGRFELRVGASYRDVAVRLEVESSPHA